jgi:hypothetical protein
VDVLFYIRSDGQHILVTDTIMAVFLLLLFCVTFWSTVVVLFYLRADGQHILVSDTIMAVFLFIFIMCDVLIRQWAFFST